MLALLVAFLYITCFVLLGGLMMLIALGSHHQPRPRSRPLRRTFLLLALSLLLWQLTLFLEVRATLSPVQLYLGRANFTAIVFAAYYALRLVQAVGEGRGQKPRKSSGTLLWLFFAGTIGLALLTLLTPLVAVEESVVLGTLGILHPVTRFGPLFPLYLLQVLGCWIAAVGLAFRCSRKAADSTTARQLTLVGWGILLTGGIAAVTNAYLPYALDDFRFCDAGTLATLFFIIAVAYAVFIHDLFALQVIVRETLVFGILLAFVLGAYTSALFVITLYLTDSAGRLSQFVVLFLAFSFDPLRRFLEKKVDRLLFGWERKGSSRAAAKRKKPPVRELQATTKLKDFPDTSL